MASELSYWCLVQFSPVPTLLLGTVEYLEEDPWIQGRERNNMKSQVKGECRDSDLISIFHQCSQKIGLLKHLIVLSLSFNDLFFHTDFIILCSYQQHTGFPAFPNHSQLLLYLHDRFVTSNLLALSKYLLGL